MPFKLTRSIIFASIGILPFSIGLSLLFYFVENRPVYERCEILKNTYNATCFINNITYERVKYNQYITTIFEGDIKFNNVTISNFNFNNFINTSYCTNCSTYLQFDCFVYSKNKISMNKLYFEKIDGCYKPGYALIIVPPLILPILYIILDYFMFRNDKELIQTQT